MFMMRLRSLTPMVQIILLVALCGVLYFPYLGSTPFFDKGEPREALAVQDIVQRGEWLFPLKKATDIPSKPPLFHWSAALASEVTGRLSESTIRFPSAVYGTLGALLLYLFGRRLFGAEIALLGGAILAPTKVLSIVNFYRRIWKDSSAVPVIAIPCITTFPIFFPKDCLGASSCLLFCGILLRRAPSRTMRAY